MISPDPAENYLSEAQSREIFDKHIRPLFIADAQPWQAGDRPPTAIILTGQSGAGKSTIARRIQEEWATDRGAPVVFDADALRPFHPDYLEAKQQSWEMEDVVTLGDARRWFETLFDASREAGMEMFPESGLREGRFESYVGRLASPPEPIPPYRVEIAILGVSPAESRLGMLDRYNEAVARIGYGRYPGDDVHDARLAGLIATADAADADPRVSGIRIYRRDGLFHYNQRDPDTGEWSSKTPTRDTLAAAQQTRLTLPESREFVARILTVATQLSERKNEADWTPQVERIMTDAAAIIDPATQVPAMPTALPADVLTALDAVTTAHTNDPSVSRPPSLPTIEAGTAHTADIDVENSGDIDAGPVGP